MRDTKIKKSIRKIEAAIGYTILSCIIIGILFIIFAIPIIELVTGGSKFWFILVYGTVGAVATILLLICIHDWAHDTEEKENGTSSEQES